MKAGRELDALVAEKVMGLVLTCPVDPRFDYSVGTSRDGTSAKRNFCRWPDGKEHWIPFYSTDIASAWQVVEKLRATHKFQCFTVSDRLIEASFWAHGTSPLNGSTVAKMTLPLAICLAALKAVGVEVEE